MNTPHWLRAVAGLLVTGAVVLLFSTQAYADCKRHGKHERPTYADLDANADGVVTSEEFYAFRARRMSDRAEEGHKLKNAKNAPSFEELDLDDDGTLSAEEFRIHQTQCPRCGKRKDG